MSTGGNVRFWFLLGVALVVVVILVGGAGGDGPPLDPRSVNPDGAKGLVETMERVGAQVVLDSPLPDETATAALLLQDRLSNEDESAIRRWVGQGGVLVVADVNSRLAALDLGRTHPVGADNPTIDQQLCTIDVLRVAERVAVSGVLLDASGGDFCFGDAQQAFIVTETLGLGTVVTVGGPDVFTNAALDDDDAAVIALNLLAPNRERARVAFLGPSLVDFGEEGLSDLVAPRVRNSIVQLLAAFLIYALYRSRRLGGVVAEPVPVRIEGSELVLKAGLLSERAKDPGSAAALLRQDFVDRASHALSVVVTDNYELLTERVAARAGMSQSEVQATLMSPISDEAGLIRLAHDVAELDRHIFGATGTSASAIPVDPVAPTQLTTNESYADD